ncbi:MAG: asparaginase [Gemmatales bacterium]|nr:asparaginase [Gemmatales bacterium]MDW8176221.1 asparaginase [Gemmatales bacterium]
MSYVPLIEVLRNDRVESVHHGAWALCDAQGRLLAARGDPQVRFYLRSSAKPFQCITVIHLGAAAQFELTDEELAVICASHGAEEVHLQAVRSILRKCGLDEKALRCGAHWPLHSPSQEQLLRRGESPLPIHNNCSGKHAGMLAACRQQNWPLDSYLEPTHPLQRANLQTMSVYSGCAEKDIALGTDGCGVPSFYMTLRSLATAYARLAQPEALPKDWLAATQRVVQSMTAHPRLVAYEGHFNTELMQLLGQHLVAKGGAEGVFGLAIPQRGWGLAIKISDGNSRAIPPFVVAWLEKHGPDLPLEPLRRRAFAPITNTRGQPVGRFRLTSQAL